MKNFMIGLLQLGMVLGVAPFLKAWIHKVKCVVRGQNGPPLTQGYRDLYKLLRKEVALSRDASWISRFAPYIVFVSPALVVSFLPVINTHALLGFTGDIIALVYILGLGTFFLALYGMDQGSAFGGLGAGREMTVASLSEPALMLVIFTFALQTGSTNISEIFLNIHVQGFFHFPISTIFALIALMIVTLAENGRMPIDNPETHLELTMVHEAMILEASGRSLALFEMASWVKLVIFLTLASNIFIPVGLYNEASPGAVILGMILFNLKLLLFSVPIGLIEVSAAKLRFFRVPDLLTLGFILSLIALILYYL